MKFVNKSFFHVVQTCVIASLLTVSSSALSDTISSVVDDFSHIDNTNLSTQRMLMTDTVAGGNTSAESVVSNGVIQLKGEIMPPRGQPGWSSLALPLGPEGEAQDASKYQGIRLLVKVVNANVSVSANSTEVTNFDYHSAQVAVKPDGKFHEVKIPFESMKRMWSEQTKLNPKTLNSLSIVAFNVQKAAFDFSVDEVSFY